MVARSQPQTRKRRSASGSNGVRKPSKAAKADRYSLYLRSVQAPDVDVGFFQRIYRSNFGRPARVLREDFCGTAAVCCEWVKVGPELEAYGIDLDPEPLAWGRQHNLSKLTAEQAARVHLVEGDVRTARTLKADIIAAQNFSYLIFTTREELRRYFRAAHAHLAREGVFILDLFGGYESFEDDREEVTDHGWFDYVWDQAEFDPITHYAKFHIHFRFDDGSELRQAFSYEWRLWTLPEVREVLLEAGFARADVYWEDTDKDTGGSSGIYRRKARGEADPAWNAYIVGVK